MPDVAPPLAIRPRELLCLICRAGRGGDRPDERLCRILRAIREDPARPVALRCDVACVYSRQNPGQTGRAPGGTLAERKRDLDVLQRLGMAPGDARPAIDLLRRCMDRIPDNRAICRGDESAGEAWRGCPDWPEPGYARAASQGVGSVVPLRSDEERAAEKELCAREIRVADRLRIRPHHLMCMACFHGGREDVGPIEADCLFELIEAIWNHPDVLVEMVDGPCMVCRGCKAYDPAADWCLGRSGMGLRDEKKDLDTLRALGMQYGDALPARELFRRLFERVPDTRGVCSFGDGAVQGAEWTVCGGPEGSPAYLRARAAGMGIPGLAGSGRPG